MFLLNRYLDEVYNVPNDLDELSTRIQNVGRFRDESGVAAVFAHSAVGFRQALIRYGYFGLFPHFIKSSRVRTELNVHLYSLSAIPKVVSKTL